MKKDIIKDVRPAHALPGAEVEILTDGFAAVPGGSSCLFSGINADIVAASSRRVLAIVPDAAIGTEEIQLESEGVISDPFTIEVGRLIADDLHIVANPAADPKNSTLVTTRSGSRGMTLENTLYRINPEDDLVIEMPASVKNPTGIAFSPKGELYVTNRADGTVCFIEDDEDVAVYASGLGIATGLAFDADGIMYVGDRSGRIYRVREFGRVSELASIEPSVAAYHIAFGPDGRLYASAPGLSSHDGIYAIDMDGNVETYCRGFGRPQGLAFDTEGNLYLAASYQGRRGIFKITPDREISMLIAGNSIVGMCFGRNGKLYVATGNSVYVFEIGVSGLLLN